MDFKDYYEILGVLPNADKKVIQQTFRQLARKVHPDVNPGNKDAEEQFKAINEAYQVLSDAKQRKKYDELRAQYQQWQRTGGRQQDFDWQNWSAQPNQGAHVQYASPEDWKTSSEAIRLIPISSPISLARRARVAEVLLPAQRRGGMSSMKSI